MGQLFLPGFEETLEIQCPLCGAVVPFVGQMSPHLPWGVCRECARKDPYPIELFVPSTRRNKDKEPIMIDPSAPSALLEKRMLMDEELRCAVDPTRLERPVVKYNLSGLELRHPIRRSKMHQYNRWHANYLRTRESRQMSLPVCEKCGNAHDRSYEMLPGQRDYYHTCQACEDKATVEAFYRHKGIFGGDDVEAVLDRIFKSHPELFARGIMPDYWFELVLQEQQQNLPQQQQESIGEPS